MSDLEKTTERRAKPARRIQIPGRSAQYSSRDPVEIANELRAGSRLGKREAKLAEAERKHAR